MKQTRDHLCTNQPDCYGCALRLPAAWRDYAMHDLPALRIASQGPMAGEIVDMRPRGYWTEEEAAEVQSMWDGVHPAFKARAIADAEARRTIEGTARPLTGEIIGGPQPQIGPIDPDIIRDLLRGPRTIDGTARPVRKALPGPRESEGNE